MKNLCGKIVSGFAFLIILTGNAVPASQKPATMGELALYRGADRQKKLEEGARKEGGLLFYTTGTEGWVSDLVARFEKRYPFLRVERWRASGSEMTARTLEEYKAGRYVVDIQNHTQKTQLIAEETGLVQPFQSPTLEALGEEAIRRAPGAGAFAAAFYEIGYGLAYNTKLMSHEEVPKSYRDLLNPKWKGKMAIGEDRGIDWMGNLLVSYGEEFVRLIAKQKIQIHNLTSLALLGLIGNGEYPFSPASSDTHVLLSKKKGAPLEWIPLEPVLISAGMVSLSKYPPRPHAALLFVDFILSKEAAESVFKANFYGSPRKDHDQKPYKKFYGAKSSQEFAGWSRLYKDLFLTPE